MLYVLLTLLALLTARPCAAGEPVVVVGQEVDEEEEYARRPGFSRSVKPAESPVSTSVGDILQREAGVRVQQLGGPGQESRVMLRGTNSHHTAVLLDGLPLTDVRFGESNLELVSTENIERIDIFQGYAPAGLDQGGIGGVVNIVSQVPQGSSVRALAGYGSWNRARAHLGASARHDGFFVQAQGNYESADNDYSFLNDNGTPVVNTADDYTDRRRNADYTSRGALLRAGSRGDSFETDVLYEYYARRQGLPGHGGCPVAHARRQYRRVMGSVKSPLASP
jgi:outer membrane receptor protein involved in Fe transport